MGTREGRLPASKRVTDSRQPAAAFALRAKRPCSQVLRFLRHTNRLVPVDNSLIFINFMNRLRAKRTDSLTNRFFLLSIRPV